MLIGFIYVETILALQLFVGLEVDGPSSVFIFMSVHETDGTNDWQLLMFI